MSVGGSNRVVYHPPKKAKKKEKKQKPLVSDHTRHQALNLAHAKHFATLLIRRGH